MTWKNFERDGRKLSRKLYIAKLTKAKLKSFAVCNLNNLFVGILTVRTLTLESWAVNLFIEIIA